MKTFLYTIVFFLATILLFSQIELKEFRAESTGNGILVSWRVDQENNFRNYVVERSEDGKFYQSVVTINPKGGGVNYEYKDEEVFKQKPDNNNEIAQNGEYFYRLKVNFKDGTSDYSDEIPVIHKTSSIRKTWGMIKEMFK